MEERIRAGFEGPWWSHPPLRNALVSGVIAGAGFVLAHRGLIGEIAENAFYWLAIPVGAYHWALAEESFESIRVERYKINRLWGLMTATCVKAVVRSKQAPEGVLLRERGGVQ